MLPVVLAACAVADWGPHWYTGGTPREVTLVTAHAPEVHPYLDAIHNDIVACDPELPWTSEGLHSESRCILLQVVKSNISTPVAPSIEFLRGAHYAAFAGTESFKTFGYTAVFTEEDSQVYYPLAADEDTTLVLVVRAPGTVAPDCASARCQNSHIQNLEALMDWAVARPIVNQTHPADPAAATVTTMYLVKGNKPLHKTKASTEILIEVAILAVVMAAAAAVVDRSTSVAESIKEIDHELYACTAVAVAAAISITYMAAEFSREMSRAGGSVARTVDGTDVALAPPKLQLMLAPGVAWAAVGFLATGIGDVIRGKDIRNSAIHRALIAFAATAAVAYAIVFPTTIEGVHGTRVTHQPSREDVRLSLATTDKLLSRTFESPADGDAALHKGVSHVNTVSVFLGMLAVGGALACAYAGHYREVTLHKSKSLLYVAAAGAFGTVAAINQLYADYHDLETLFVCADARHLRRDTNVYLFCASVAYCGSLVLCLLAMCRKPAVGKFLAQAGVLAIALGATLHLTPTYVQTHTPCAALESAYRSPMVSAMAVSVVVSALIVHGISPCEPIDAPSDAEKAPPYKMETPSVF